MNRRYFFKQLASGLSVAPMLFLPKTFSPVWKVIAADEMDLKELVGELRDQGTETMSDCAMAESCGTPIGSFMTDKMLRCSEHAYEPVYER